MIEAQAGEGFKSKETRNNSYKFILVWNVW